MTRPNETPITVKQIESIVASCRAFAHLEQASDSDLTLWSHFLSGTERVDRYNVRNNAQRINEIIGVLAQWEGMKNAGSAPKLLEVGAGYGEVALSMAQAFPSFSVYGIEHPNRGFFFADSYQSTLNQSGITMTGADLDDRRLPFADATFDAVLFCEVLEHVSPVEAPRIIAELARVVKPGGAVVMASPNLVSLYNRLVFLSGVSAFTPAIPLDYAGGTYGHIRLYSVRELETLATRAGLSLEHVTYSNSMLIAGAETKLRSILVKRVQIPVSWLMPSLANGWTVLFTKDE